ncbi:MAG: ribosome small subunit-dependent GTPase A [Microscillaceae bacterium]|nr:ribosome small subunit-dependent GTPase A [Microscillaceae bacterium]
MLGLVMRSTGSWYDVKRDDNDSLIRCRLRGKFKIKGLKVTNPIAVGDWVEWEWADDQEGTGLITNILPRENYLIRKSVHKTGHAHMLAANLDQTLLIATLAMPRTSLGFIDRFLVSAETFRIPSRIIFNKSDLLNEDDRELIAALRAIYEPLGYPCLLVSALDGEGMGAVEALLKGRKSLISGHSGVGKSSLVNRIAPDLDLRTSAVSTFANKGVHTTTFAEMFEIAPQTFLIDTPGIKELGLVDIAPEELGHYFPEMRARLGYCKYHNCQHTNEPGCAIKAAVEAQQISFTRYESYLSMLSDQDNRR